MSARVKSIFRYPIKSMAGGELSEVILTEQGIPGDRCWALKDETRGGLFNAKRSAQLLELHAELIGPASLEEPSPNVRITLPNGEALTTEQADIHPALSQHLGAEVSLWPLLPKEQLDHYRRIAPDQNVDQEAALREAFGRLEHEPLPDLSVFPAELFEYESPPGTYFDAFPLLLLSEASLETLQASSEAQIDVRRFRPNLLIDMPGSGFPEEQWLGKRLRIGGAVLHAELACPRCIVTTHGFADLPKEPKVMRSLVQANGGNLGVYANVVQPGRIAPGDELIPE